MSISRKHIISEERKHCAVCGGNGLEVVIELPGLPLTDTYCREPVKDPVGGIDQQLLICNKCHHAQLAKRVNPAVLYGENYNFRTSASETARRGTGFFLSMLDDITGKRRFSCVLDVGCNDLYLLKQLQNRCDVRVGIDPLWASKENQRDDNSIILIGAAIEDVDLNSVLDAPAELVVCRHTLEHIYEPREVLQRLFTATAENALFLFEVPGFDALVRRLRFDQIFHQHLQYFSLASFQRLVKDVGGVYIGHRENYHDWGAMVVAFAKQRDCKGPGVRNTSDIFGVPAIRKRYAAFRRQASGTNNVLKMFEGTTVYGYGAAQMLPVLSYHLNNDLSALKAILDDDMSKDGLHYSNLPVTVRHTGIATDIDTASVFITAVDNAGAIMSKLLTRRPRHILYPFPVI